MLRLVKFSAPWCMPCRQYAPVVEKFAEETDNIELVSIDIEQDPDTASRYGVSTVPYTVLEDAETGDIYGGFSGPANRKQLEGIVKRYLEERS